MENIPMYTPTRDYHNHKEEYDQAIQSTLKHGQLIMGPEVAELECKLAEYTGSKHCIAMGSGTDALLAALLALNIGQGDKVITVPFTWISTAEVISLTGAQPIFIDIEEHSYNLDPTLLKHFLENCKDIDNIKAIICVNLYGQMPDYIRINAIAKWFNIPVIEDAAQSFGAHNSKGTMSCNSTLIGCTSFYPSKPLGCFGDGGACFTNDNELAKSLRSIRTHGSDANDRFKHSIIGFNGRLDTIQAAILLVKLKYFDESIRKRISNAHAYNEAFKHLKGQLFNTPTVILNNKHVMAQYTLNLNSPEQRDKLYAYLKQKGVGCAIFYPVPLHKQPVFEQYNNKCYPVTEKVCGQVLSLPIYPELTLRERGIVIATILEFGKLSS